MDEAVYLGRHELLFNTRRSRRYHMWRVKFFRRLNNARMALFLVTSSIAFSVVMGAMNLQKWGPLVTAIVALLALAEVVVRAGAKETQHHNLARAFVELEAEVVGHGERLTELDLDRLRTKYLKIELDEPPVLKSLNKICYNEELHAQYGDGPEFEEHRYEIGPFTQFWAQISDIRPHKVTPSWTPLTEPKQ